MDSKKFDFMWNVHSYQNEYIRFADTKAIVVLGWVSAISGLMISLDRHHLLFKPKEIDWSLAVFGLLAPTWMAFISLTVSFIACVFVLFPRLPKSFSGKSENTLIFWDEVQSFKNASDYNRAIEAATDQDLIRKVSQHLFTLSEISRLKYQIAQWALGAGVVGTLFAGLVVLATS